MARRSLVAVAAAAVWALAGCSAGPSPRRPWLTRTPVLVHAAGSLREAFTEIARDHEARTGQKVALAFGASGLLRRIEKGEPAQVFASADTDHPQRLAARGGWSAPVVFTRNALCALTSEQISATPDTLLATLLRSFQMCAWAPPRPRPTRRATTPGRCSAWPTVQAGAYAQLDAKALKLTGGADSPKPPAGRGTYAWVMDQRQADVFLTYCTNAVAAQTEVPRLRVVQLPPALQVGAAYGLTVRADAPAAAQAFAEALRQPAAQAVLRRRALTSAAGR